MNQSKLVSIILPTYNAEKYIDACVESLLAQTYRYFELLICDDCSSDGTYEKLLAWKEKDSRIILLRNEETSYAAATRNRCIKASHGEYYLLQDADDISEPKRLEKLMDAINEPGVDFVSSRMAAFNDDPEKITEVMDVGIEYPKKKNFLWGLPFHHPTTLFSKKCIDDVGGYRVAEETRKGQDYDLYMRLYAKGYCGKNIPDVLYRFRRDAANIRRRDFTARKWEYNVRKYGFKEMGMMPFAYPFTLKPFLAHFVQKIRFASVLKEDTEKV